MQSALWRTCFLAWALLLPALLPAVGQATTPAPSLVLGTNDDKVDVTSRFRGRDLLIFGALSHPGQVIVVLRSPDTAVAVTRKNQIGPLWITGQKVTVSHFPGVLQILSSAPLDRLLPAAKQSRFGLNPRTILEAASYQPLPRDAAAWQNAVLAAKEKQGAYRINPNGVRVQDGRLFSAHLHLPASLPLGTYDLDVYLVNKGKILAQSSQTIDVQQVGIEEWIARFAEGEPWLFGIVLTVCLASLGLGLGIVMQRKS